MRSIAIALVVALTVGSAIAQDSPPDAPRPNVLFIAVDDLNDWIGCLGGHPQARTPNLDRLAASGVLFRNAYCAGASCNPSRTAIFTGRAPHRTGLYRNTQKMREVLPDEVILPMHLSAHGYWSAGGGKLLHYFVDGPSWDEYFPSRERENPFPRTLYPEERPVTLPREPWMYVETDWGPLDATLDEYGGDYLVSEWAARELARERDQPFFLACGIYRPHEPWFVPAEYFDRFPLEDVQMPPGYLADDLDDVPEAGQRIARNRYLAHIQEHDLWRSGVRAYLAAISFADDMVGRILDALDKSPHRDDTIVVLWSDHGWHLGEKEHWQKYTGWRVCARVPLMVRVPPGLAALPAGTPTGAVCDAPVNLLDMFPTLTELCGVPAKPGVDGHSLLPLLRDPDAEWAHASLTHLDRPQNYAISARRHRYIHYHDGGEELYDVVADPHEWENLAARPEHAETLETMRALAPTQIAPAADASDARAPGTAPANRLRWHDAGDGPCPPSAESNASTEVVFENRRAEPVQLTWVTPGGYRRGFGDLEAGASRRLTTFAKHAWVILTVDGDELGHFIAGDAPSRAIIPRD